MDKGNTEQDLIDAGYKDFGTVKTTPSGKEYYDITNDLRRVFGDEVIPEIFESEQYWKDKGAPGNISYNCISLGLAGAGHPYYRYLFKNLPKIYYTKAHLRYYGDKPGYLKSDNIRNRFKEKAVEAGWPGAGKWLQSFYMYERLMMKALGNSYRFEYTGKEQLRLGQLGFVYYNDERDYHFPLILGLRNKLGEQIILHKPGMNKRLELSERSLEWYMGLDTKIFIYRSDLWKPCKSGEKILLMNLFNDLLK